MRLQQQLADEPIGSLQLRDAILCDPHTVVRAAVALMRSRSIGCAVIVRRGRIPCGLFSERSLLRVLINGASLDEQAVGDYAEPEFIVVRRTDPIARVWDAVVKHKARFVCVTDEEGRVVGLTGQRGLSEFIADSFASRVTTQRLGSTPWIAEREGA